jgi:hypothetical protein
MARLITPADIRARIATRENVWDMVTYINKQLKENKIEDDISVNVIGWDVLNDHVIENLLEIYTNEGWIITDIDTTTKNFKVPDSSNSGIGGQHG